MTTTSRTRHLAELLSALADRAQDEKPQLDVAVDVLADLGRFTWAAPANDVRHLQAALAAARQRVTLAESGQELAATALNGVDGRAFLAGALWAADAWMAARLQVADELSNTAERSNRAALRESIRRTLRANDIASPTDMLQAAARDGLDATADRLSKALSDLLRDADIEPAQPPQGADRRSRYYKLRVHTKMASAAAPAKGRSEPVSRKPSPRAQRSRADSAPSRRAAAT